MTAEPRCCGGGGGVSHPSQLTTGLVIKSVTTSPTLAGERMLFILQVSILSEQTDSFVTESQHPRAQASGARRRLRSTIPPSRYNLWQKRTARTADNASP